MKILAYGLNYAPELTGIGKYSSELCEWLVAQGHTVEFVAGHPYYPDWKLAEGYDNRTYQHEVRGGVNVHHCPLYLPRVPTGKSRILSHVSFAASSTPKLIEVARRFKPDVMLAVTPSLFITPVAAAVAKLFGIPCWLHVQDFEVDAAFELGMLKGSRLRRIATAIESFLLRRFDQVSTISPRMRDRLLVKGVSSDRVVEFRNWVDTTTLVPSDRRTRFREQLGLSEQNIVALYSGSIAAKQGIERLVHAAAKLQHLVPELIFVFCGSGVLLNRLKELAAQLPNVRFLPLQPNDRMLELMATADIHLIPQQAEVADLMLPSKLAPILASGRPAVAMAAPGTQLASEIEGAGIAISPTDDDEIVSAILSLAQNSELRARMGERGRLLACSRWDKNAILVEFEAQLTDLARPHTNAGKADPKTNLAVCGDFKQLQMVPELNRVAHLGCVYYASRLSNNAEHLKLDKAQARNLFLKEYLIQFHARYLSHAMSDTIYPLYDKIWLRAAHDAWQSCDVLHVVLQGKALSLIKRAKAEGTAVLGHPIVCHPAFFEREMQQELDRLSINPAPFLAELEETADEIALCDRIFCLSSLVRDSFVAEGFPADKIDIIPLPTDLQTFTPGQPRPSTEPFRVICVAELNPIKGHVYLLEAWKSLNLPNAELIFVGTMRREMKAVLKPYEGLFTYLGPLGRRDLVDLYQTSSLLVLPSVQDGFGFVVTEAIACGLPAIVTEHVGARDIITPGVNGYVVPPRDPAAIADKIARIHASPSLQSTLRDGAIASRDTFPSMTETAERIAAAYRATSTMRKAPSEVTETVKTFEGRSDAGRHASAIMLSKVP